MYRLLPLLLSAPPPLYATAPETPSVAALQLVFEHQAREGSGWSAANVFWLGVELSLPEVLLAPVRTVPLPPLEAKRRQRCLDLALDSEATPLLRWAKRARRLALGCEGWVR